MISSLKQDSAKFEMENRRTEKAGHRLQYPSGGYDATWMDDDDRPAPVNRVDGRHDYEADSRRQRAQPFEYDMMDVDDQPEPRARFPPYDPRDPRDPQGRPGAA